ncbi:MAG: PEP-CTERM sorting domain-containing protein [Nitrospirales bacterium]|nr:PEP-CTERM sorting domain-containing protein [Nitrospirales bacterium]
MMTFKRLVGMFAITVTILCTVSALPVFADSVIFEASPTNLSSHVSHRAVGPVLADDFIPNSIGFLTKVEWWGSAEDSIGWELNFFTDSGTGEPNIDDPTVGSLRRYIVVPIVTVDDPSHPEIYHFTTTISFANDVLRRPPFEYSSAREYWFSVANFDDGWTWAEALNGRTVGLDIFKAHESNGSLCGNSGPNCGPWTDINTNFAFRLSAVVPEPSTWFLLSTGLIILLLGYRWLNGKERGPHQGF